MNIELPKKFTFKDQKSRWNAYVKDGNLYIKGNVSLKKVMYELTYALYGEKCFYCGKRLNHKTRTIDHMYPRAFGGVSITNNLRPSCSTCNSKCKGDMTYFQYKKYLKCKTDKERKNYRYEKVFLVNERRKNKGKCILPKSWLEEYDITELLNKTNFDCLKNNNIGRNIYINPIVISSEGYVFSGAKVLYRAKKDERKKVLAVVLENVHVLR